MKSIFNRIISFLLAVIIIFSSALVGLNEIDFSGIFAVKAEAASSEDLIFTLSGDGTFYYVKADKSIKGEIIIPDTYNDLPVARINDYAFSNCRDLTSVTILGGVEYIYDSAFEGCSNLTSIVLPDSVTYIGRKAFYNCRSLTSITLPDSISFIGRNAFYNTGYDWVDGVLYVGDHLIQAEASLSGEYTIKDNTKLIAEEAFYSCKNLTSITIPDSVSYMNREAFGYCTSLEAVHIADISKWCSIFFYGGTANPLSYAHNLYLNGELVTDIVLPDNVTNIGEYAFDSCTSLTSVTCGADINWRAFEDCTNLKSLTFKDGVTRVSGYAFDNCSSLETISFADSVTGISGWAFLDCTSLQSVYISDISAWCNIDFDGHLSNPLEYAPNLYLNNKLVTDLVIPDDVTSIGGYTFSGYIKLDSVTISEGVTSIGECAFQNCTNLTSITIPDSVTSIGEEAFYNCIKLNSVCVTDVGAWCSINFEEDYSNPLYYAHSLYINGELVSGIVIPDGVTNIPGYAFDCLNITSIRIPNSVNTIESNAFGDSKNLKYVFFDGEEAERNVLSIGNNNEYLLSACWHYNTIDHVCEEIILVQSSCVATGLKYIKCAICDYKTEIEPIPATGHKAGSWKTEKKATVDASGSKYKECKVCKEVLETATIKQLKCATPKLKSVTNVATGVKFSWNKVSGADNYEVYRKTGKGKWTKIATVKGTVTSFTDKTAKSGTTYKYSVSAKNEAGSSKYNTTGLTIKCLADPVLKTPTSAQKGITLKWSKVTGAQGYEVYRKAGSGKFVKLTTVKGATKVSFVDKSAKKGTKYTYKLRAYSGKTYSEYSNGKTIKDKY